MKAILLLVLVEIAVTFAYSSCVSLSPNTPTHVINPLPYDAIVPKLPASLDWRNMNGRNLVTITRNQHLPQYCGSCWAFASTSALGDRMRIHTNAALPDIVLAPQVLVNCVSGSTCHGGDPGAVYEYIRTQGIPDETCAPYQAADLTCTPENICMNCGMDMKDPQKLCVAQKNYTTYYVAEHGQVNGTQNMMAEILARGPIACIVAVTPALEAYTGGIFNDTTGDKDPDHVVSVVGWGQEGNVPYWIVRNSWGTFWGEIGWFRIVQGVDNLGIESQGCFWATPKF